MTLNAAFIQVFGEGLVPHGFVKLKGSNRPFFIRLIGNEIIHVITCVPRPAVTSVLNSKQFDVLCGVATVYRNKIDLKTDIKRNLNWFKSNSWLYMYENPFDFDRDYWLSIRHFVYLRDNDESLLNEMQHCLEITEQIMLPVLDKVTTLTSCIEYFYKFDNSLLNIYPDDEDFGLRHNDGEHNESFLLINSENYADIIEKNIERYNAIYKHNVELNKPGYTQEEYEKRCQRIAETKQRHISPIEKILKTSELYAKFTDELKRRKAENTETLRSYGLKL